MMHSEERYNYRFRRPFYVLIDGAQYEGLDISIQGLSFYAPSGVTFESDQAIELNVKADKDIHYHIEEAEVANARRMDDDRMVYGLRITQIDELALLRHHLCIQSVGEQNLMDLPSGLLNITSTVQKPDVKSNNTNHLPVPDEKDRVKKQSFQPVAERVKSLLLLLLYQVDEDVEEQDDTLLQLRLALEGISVVSADEKKSMERALAIVDQVLVQKRQIKQHIYRMSLLTGLSMSNLDADNLPHVLSLIDGFEQKYFSEQDLHVLQLMQKGLTAKQALNQVISKADLENVST